MTRPCAAAIPDVCAHRAVHRHHLVLRSRGGTDHPANLVDVCLPCHAWIHANPADATALGLIQSPAACTRCGVRIHPAEWPDREPGPTHPGTCPTLT